MKGSFATRILTLITIRQGFKSCVLTCATAWMLTGALLISSASVAHAAERPCRPATTDERLPVDFRQVSLETVGRYVSCAAEIGLVYSPSTLRSRTVSVVAPRPVGVAGLIRIFEAALRDHGMFMERRGAFYVISEDAQAPSKSFSTSGR